MRARCPHAVVRRAPSRSGQVARWLLIAAAALAVVPGAAQQEDSPTTLTGTLRKTRDSGSITIAYRASSIPFSYLSPRGEPIGYSIDLCKLLVEAISDEVGRTLAIRWQAVTPETRIASIASGQSDLECGSTTSNVERRKTVAFSPTIFVSGTKLMVKKGSPIRSFRDLAGKKVVVTSGTTNEAAMKRLNEKYKLGITIVAARDHEESYSRLVEGKADAFATDDVLLQGFIVSKNAAASMEIVGDFITYEPYGIMFRKDDPQIADAVTRAFAFMAQSRRLSETYRKWFLDRTPTGELLNLPLSVQLAETFRNLGMPD